MFNKQTMTSDQIIAFLKDANVTGATVDNDKELVTLHIDEGSPDVSFSLSGMFGKYVLKQLGKGLSSNDFTDALKERLESIKDQVNSDWDETNPEHSTYIENKPDLYLPSQDTRDLLDSLRDTGNGLVYGSGKAVDSMQADYTQEDTDKQDYIKNKPDLSELHHHRNAEVLDSLTDNGSGILRYNGIIISGEQSDWSTSDDTEPSFIKNKPTLYDPDNMEVLDKLDVDGNGQLTYNGIPVNTENQPDWEETNTGSPFYIRNKPYVYSPSEELRAVLNGFDESDDEDLTWRSNEIAMKDELIAQTSVQKYGLVSEVIITTA